MPTDRAQWNKGMEATRESLKMIKDRLPFFLNHIHPDCGTEFLNQMVMVWSKEENIDVSRSRSYRKNDNGYIEQRNGHKLLHEKLEKMKCDILKANRLATGRDHFNDI